MSDHTEIGKQNGFSFLERLTSLILHKRKIAGNPDWIAKNNPKVINFIHPNELKVSSLYQIMLNIEFKRQGSIKCYRINVLISKEIKKDLKRVKLDAGVKIPNLKEILNNLEHYQSI